jgi:hypothetical protein
MQQDAGNWRTEDGLLRKCLFQKEGRPRMIRDRRLLWIFGLAGVNRRVPFAVVVEAEVGDKVFAHDAGAGGEVRQKA